MSVDVTYNTEHEPNHVLFTPQTKEELQSEIVRFRSGLIDKGLPNTWDVSNVTDMSHLFENDSVFNEPIGDWNVSNVTNMTGMFASATSFNQPIDKWFVLNAFN